MAAPRKEQPLPKIAGPHLVSLLKSSLQRSPIQMDYLLVFSRNKTGLIVRLGGEVHCLFLFESRSLKEAIWLIQKAENWFCHLVQALAAAAADGFARL